MGPFPHNDTMKIDFNTYNDNENNEYNAPMDNFESFKNLNDPKSSMIPSKIMNTCVNRQTNEPNGDSSQKTATK